MALAVAAKMSPPVRVDIPNVVYLETFRCQHGRFLMMPDEEFNELMLGAMGRALELYPNVRLYDFCHLPNHGHRFISSTDGVSRSRFSQYVNQRISEESRRRYGWSKIFTRPTRPIACLDHQAQLDKFEYIRAHGLKEHLVERADELPCISALPFLRDGTPIEGTFIWRDAETRAKKRHEKRNPGVPFDSSPFEERYPVVLSKLPAMEHMSWEEIREYTGKLTRELEERYAAERTRPVLGVERMLAQHPYDRPKKVKNTPAPLAHCRDPKRLSLYRRLVRFLTDALRSANRAVRRGEANVTFPPFCYPARLPYVSWQDAQEQAERGSYLPSTHAQAPPGHVMPMARATSPPTLDELLEQAALLPA